MENASKALVIAGGVLLGLMVIAVLMYTVQNSGQYKQVQEDAQKMEQIAVFNRDYESYDKDLMRGTDVLTVVNKAANYNEANDLDKKKDKDRYIETTIILTSTDISINVNNVEKIMKIKREYHGNDEIYQQLQSDNSAMTIFKRRFFKCTEVKYNNQTGYINYMKFEEISVGEIPDY